MNGSDPQPELELLPPPECLFCDAEAMHVVVPEETWEPEQRFPALCTQCTKRLGWAIRSLPTNTLAWCVEDVLSPEAAVLQVEEFLNMH